MKTHPSLLLLMAILGTGVIVRAAGPYQTDVNPALLYWQAFSQVPELSPEEAKLFKRRQTATTDEGYRGLVERYDTVFRLVRRGTDLKQSADWGVDLADGPEALLPHLAKAKSVAQAAQLRARYFLDHGKEGEAVKDLLSALVLGRHIASDGVLISALVGMAVDGIVVTCAAENFHAFSSESFQRLLDGIHAAPPANTISECIGRGERSFGHWYCRKIESIHATHGGDEEKSLSEIRELMAATLSEEKSYAEADKFIRAAGGTVAGLRALGKSADQFYDEMQAVAALPYERFESANKTFFEKVENSGNPFVSFFFPALQNSRVKEFRGQARMEMLRAALQYRLNGEAGLQGVRDPFGSGPFQFRRFVFQKEDRGFELRSNFAYADEFPEAVIFVAKRGPAFFVLGPSAGKPLKDN